MMVILDAMQSVFTIFIMIAVGYILTAKGWFDDKVSKLFSKLVVTISLPAFMVSNLTSTFTKDKLSEAGIGLLVPLLSMMATYLLSILVSNLLKIKKERRGTFRVMFALSNTIFIGLPVNLALFGEESVPYVLLYYIINTCIFWSIGVYGIRQDGGAASKGIFTLDSLKKILNPPIISFILTVSLIMLDIRLPKSILDSTRYIGNLTTPLSMLFIGIIIHSLKLKDLRFDRSMAAILVGRFILAPLIIFAFFGFFELPLLMRKVYIIEAAMPVMTQAAIVAQAYNADHKYATIMATVSTAASLIFIPIYMVIFSVFI
jgi:malate permease and related proteins